MYKNLAATFVAACFFLSAVQAQTPPQTHAPLKVGFVYVSPITEAGWTKVRGEDVGPLFYKYYPDPSVHPTHAASPI